MAQVTIYMNDKIEQKVKKLAKSMNLSISKYISSVLEQKTADSWNIDIKNLSGAWSQFSSIEDIRSNESIKDAPRESL